MGASCMRCGGDLKYVITDREDRFGVEFCRHCGKVCGGVPAGNHEGHDFRSYAKAISLSAPNPSWVFYIAFGGLGMLFLLGMYLASLRV